MVPRVDKQKDNPRMHVLLGAHTKRLFHRGPVGPRGPGDDGLLAHVDWDRHRSRGFTCMLSNQALGLLKTDLVLYPAAPLKCLVGEVLCFI